MAAYPLNAMSAIFSTERTFNFKFMPMWVSYIILFTLWDPMMEVVGVKCVSRPCRALVQFQYELHSRNLSQSVTSKTALHGW